jgi:hypothetical protein
LTPIPRNSFRPDPGPLTRSITLTALFLLGILLELLSPAARGQDFESSSFVLRNHSPFSAIIGIPGRWPDGTSNIAELSWNLSSHSFYENDGAESLLLDGETQTFSARLQHRFAQRIQLGADIPWLAHSGGFMDGTIDSWHDLTGLPEGVRPGLEKNDLQYIYAVNGANAFKLSDSASGLGDIQVNLAVALGALDEQIDASYLRRLGWMLNFSADLPTGDVDKLTGNGGTDLAAGLGVRSPRADASRFDWWLDLGIAWPGEIDIAGLNTSGQVFYYDAALAWRVQKRFDIVAQVGGNSALYQSNIKMLGQPAAQAVIGGLWHIFSNYGLRFGITEDIRANTAPDVGFEITLIFKDFRKRSREQANSLASLAPSTAYDR